MRKRLVFVVAPVAILAISTVGVALAQARPGTRQSGGEIHVVLPATQQIEFFDFNSDGLTLGDRLAAVGPLLNEAQTRRVGTSYADCWVGDRVLEDQSPYVCAYVLKFRDGTITTEGLDPHGISDVYFAVTGGTGVYEGATGQAQYIDSPDLTEIIIRLGE
jgi:hypothetical protein